MNPNRLLLSLLPLLRPADMAASTPPLLSFCRLASRRTTVRAAADPRRRRRREMSREMSILAGGERTAARPESVAIVGGGLAGLSVAYHLTDGGSSREGRRRRVTVFDRCPVGEGGASSGEACAVARYFGPVGSPLSSLTFLLPCSSCRWVSDGIESSISHYFSKLKARD